MTRRKNGDPQRPTTADPAPDPRTATPTDPDTAPLSPPDPEEAEASDDDDGDDDDGDAGDETDESTGFPECPFCGERSTGCPHLVADYDRTFCSLDAGYLSEGGRMAKLRSALGKVLRDCARLGSVTEYGRVRREYLSLIKKGSSRDDALYGAGATTFILDLLPDALDIDYVLDEGVCRTCAYTSWWAENPAAVYQCLLDELKDARDPGSGNVDFSSWAAVEAAFGGAGSFPVDAVPGLPRVFPSGLDTATRATVLARLAGISDWPALELAEALIAEDPVALAAEVSARPTHQVRSVAALAQTVCETLADQFLPYPAPFGFVPGEAASRIRRVRTFISALTNTLDTEPLRWKASGLAVFLRAIGHLAEHVERLRLPAGYGGLGKADAVRLRHLATLAATREVADIATLAREIQLFGSSTKKTLVSLLVLIEAPSDVTELRTDE